MFSTTGERPIRSGCTSKRRNLVLILLYTSPLFLWWLSAINKIHIMLVASMCSAFKGHSYYLSFYSSTCGPN